MDATLVGKADQLARELAASAGTVEDLNALMRGMMKVVLERMLDAEMQHHLDAVRTAVEPTPDAKPNRRNGHSPKTVSGDLGPIALDAPATATAPSSLGSSPNTNAGSPGSTTRSSRCTRRA
jgi:putative transposase